MQKLSKFVENSRLKINSSVPQIDHPVALCPGGENVKRNTVKRKSNTYDKIITNLPGQRYRVYIIMITNIALAWPKPLILL